MLFRDAEISGKERARVSSERPDRLRRRRGRKCPGKSEGTRPEPSRPDGVGVFTARRRRKVERFRESKIPFGRVGKLAVRDRFYGDSLTRKSKFFPPGGKARRSTQTVAFPQRTLLGQSILLTRESSKLMNRAFGRDFFGGIPAADFLIRCRRKSRAEIEIIH